VGGGGKIEAGGWKKFFIRQLPRVGGLGLVLQQGKALVGDVNLAFGWRHRSHSSAPGWRKCLEMGFPPLHKH
jgi:hypothetical protein